MLKKLALFSAAVCLAASTVATAGNGLYVGTGIGYQTLKSQINVTETPVAGVSGSTTYSTHGDGVVGNLFVGYGLCLTDSFWAGLEFNGNFASTKDTVSDSVTLAGVGTVSSVDRVRVRGSYGVTFRPAYFTSEQTKVFGVIGWQRGRFEHTQNATVAGATLASVTTNRWINGIRYGGGIETNLTNQLGLRGEFTQTRYNRINVVSSATVAGTVRPITNEVTVNLVWTIGDLMGMGNAVNSMTA